MKYLIIDTESSDLFDFSKPADAEGQPRLAEFAAILCDEKGEMLDKMRFLVRPDGWEMKPAATAVNGLTTAFLLEHGKPVMVPLLEYTTLIRQGCVVVSYNAQFDSKVMRGELRRANMPDLFEQTPTICLMRASTPICKVPRKTGTGYKFPKLEEACAFFGIKQAGAHGAEPDAAAAHAIFLRLLALGALPSPEVHYAKNPPAK